MCNADLQWVQPDELLRGWLLRSCATAARASATQLLCFCGAYRIRVHG